MTSYKSDLTIDFGSGGYEGSRVAFRVRLESSQLSDLMVDASNAYRIYELMLINRPGDVWRYVSVGIETAPESVINRLKHVREKGKIESSQYPWSLEEVPFKVFDKIFYWDIDYTEPEDDAWFNRDPSVMNKYAEQLLEIVRKAQNSLDRVWNGDLVSHIVALVKSGNHPYDFLEREAAIAMHGWKLPPPEHTEDFYKKLRELICEPELASITYFGNGDYTILKMLATEQRRRANLTQHSPDHAIQIDALVNQTIDNGAWDSTIRFSDESFKHGDLFIQGHGLMGEPWGEVPRSNIPGRHILSIQDEGDIQGFSKISGDGCFLYTRKKPNDRRLGLECRRSSPAVLSFEHGATLFGHEKALFFVGEDVDTPAREALAVLIADWEAHSGDPALEAHSGDPVLVVIGDTQPFEAQKCLSLFEIPASLTSHEAKRQWLSDLIRMERPWLDAIFALDAPSWAAEELNWRAEFQDEPWSPWVVSSSTQKDLKASYVVQGDLATALREAHQRAKSTRPQPF
jgi:hypothetical protein